MEKIIEKVFKRISFIASRRKIVFDNYFTLAAFPADESLLQSLASEALAWLIARTGGKVSYSIDNEKLSFTLSGEKISEGLDILLRHYLLRRIVFMWLELTGLPDSRNWNDDSEAAMVPLLNHLSQHGPLFRRPVSPF